MYEFSLLDLSKEKFIAVVNEENGCEIDHTQVMLASKEDPNPGEDTDSILMITPAPGSKYKGTKELKFKRLDPVKLVAMFGGNLAVSLPTTKEVALETLKQRHGIVIDPESEVRFMDPNDKHLMVIDNHFALSQPMVINLVPLSPMLSEFLTVPELGNLNYNLPGHEDNWDLGDGPGLLMLRDRLYGVDFTPWIEANNIELSTSSYRNFTNEEIDSLVKFCGTKLYLAQDPSKYTGALYGSTGVAVAINGEHHGAMPGFTHYLKLQPKDMYSDYYYMLHFNMGEK